MKCSNCQCSGHNKRTCPQFVTPSVKSVKAVVGRFCSGCGECGHNKRTCPQFVTPPVKSVKAVGRICSGCGECGHNKRTCPQFVTPSVKSVKAVVGRICSGCGECGHNKRTCNTLCKPCSVPRSYCFAGMTAERAVKMTKLLECESIYDETEEYPHLMVSPQAMRKTEQITFANGETLDLDLGPVV